MDLIKERINQLEILALEAEINGEKIDSMKYTYAAMELHRINHKLLIQAIDECIINLKPNNIVTNP